ncbi:ABC transporter ATP-binding protein [Bariatricus sp. SGI.154]|uniref:ABC transporter ATP-binding protein n=1 Tax=Bariatricus sp. SGI.154 TaxID=3420549 RepID=UPI003D01BD9E
MNEYVAETKNLTKYYHDTCALNQANISIKRGEIYGLVGDNGAGKSTFLKLLSGQIHPTSGDLTLFGQHMPQKLMQARSRMGVLIENPGFYPQLTIEQNMEYYRIQKGVPGKDSVEEALKITGLLHIRKKRCKGLSLGMKQRLGLAIALLGVPEFLLLDEPINGLDPSGILEMRNLLLKLNEEKNITILISSHILSELEQIATVYGFLKNGYLLQQITAEQLRKKCSDYIEILVSDPEQYAVLLEQKLHHGDYQILPDRRIHILNADETIDTYSRLASDAGLQIMKLTRYRQSLEDYYMNLKNGGAKTC